MSKEFVELVFDCPLMLIKGFLRGLITCREEDIAYFFNKLEGIKSETMKETIKEWLGLESHVHLCVEDGFAEYLKKALEKNYSKLKVNVVSERKIKEACFNFSFFFFEKSVLNAVREGIEKLGEELGECRIDFEKGEEYQPIADDFGGGLTPVVSSKRYFLNGRVCGDLPSVVKIRKRLAEKGLGDVSKISLVFD